MKTLAICGDSWFTTDLQYPAHSFGEVLSEMYDYKLLSLARGGCSNFAISLQVRKAIELNADIVIIGATTPDRIEIPIISSNLSSWEKLKKAFDWHSWNHTQPSSYIPANGISNVKYFPGVELSGSHDFLQNPTIISESMNNLAFQLVHRKHYYNLLTTDQIIALKQYMLNLYDTEIKRQYDTWAINDACRQLLEKNIPFLVSVDNLYLEEEHQWIPAVNKLESKDFDLCRYPAAKTRFHYPVSASKDLADYLQSRIEKLF